MIWEWLWRKRCEMFHSHRDLTNPLCGVARCLRCGQEYFFDWHMERRRAERREMQEEAFREVMGQ